MTLDDALRVKMIFFNYWMKIESSKGHWGQSNVES